MPQYSQVAQVGDTVRMGLQGDPLFPPSYSISRPTATVESVDAQGDEHLVHLRMGDGSSKTVSSMSLAPDSLWEFSDATLAEVMEREQARHQHVRVDEAKFRGLAHAAPAPSVAPEAELATLEDELRAERERNAAFRGVAIDSVKGLAEDIRRLDTARNCRFCHVFGDGYDRKLGTHRR